MLSKSLRMFLKIQTDFLISTVVYVVVMASGETTESIYKPKYGVSTNI